MRSTYLLYLSKSLKTVITLNIIFFGLLSTTFAQQKSKLIQVPNYTNIGYLEYLPSDYNSSSGKYPVMIFLHGVGERGNGTTDLSKVRKSGPPKMIDDGHKMQFTVNGKKQSMIVISPQLRADYNSWPAFYTDLVVEHVKKTYRVDTDRIYLTGLSLGGGGCWTYVSYKAEYAKKIAAIVPIAGHQAYDASKVSNITNNKVATWAIHGGADSSTPLRYSKDWVNGINNKSSGLAKLTVYDGVGHSGAWERGYKTDHSYHNPNIYEWSLQQKRGAAVSSNPSPEDPEPSASPSSTSGDCGCDHVITSSNPYVNGESLGVKPGDVVCVQAGQYAYLNLFNFKGTSSAPITIKNCGGQVKIGNSDKTYGIVMNNNHYIRFTGTGHSGTQYGFKVDGGSKYLGSGFAIAGKSSDFEIDHIDITKVEAGVLAKTNPSCDASTWKGNYTMRNVKFHDFYIHGIKGEGFYIGHTSLTVTINCSGSTKQVEPHRIEGLRVYNNKIENAGWDGIQVAQASKDCHIYNNSVYNYGTANKSSQQAGIIVGGNSTGKVYKNWIKKGTGSGIQVFGTGTITVYNNIVKDAGEDAIFCDDRSPVAMKVRFVNNTIINAKDAGIRMYSDVTSGNVAKNNIIVSNNGKYIVKLNGNVKLTQSNNHNTNDISKVKFTNPSGEEYKLQSSSPVINSGADASSYGVTDGYYGNSRPAGGKYDIGASEYPGSTGGGSGGGSTSGENGLNYQYYEGTWSSMPNYATLNAKETGSVSNFSLSPRNRNDNFGFRFTGYIDIQKAGTYTFYLASDDGSLMYIDGTKVVDNNGLHAKRGRLGSKYLSKGKHAIKVCYFERGGNEVLEVRYQGPGISKRLIPDNVLFKNNNSREEVASKFSAEEETMFLSEGESLSEEILMYPNPVQDELNITIQGKQDQELSIKILESTGKLVYENKMMIDSESEIIQLDVSQHIGKLGLFYIVVEDEFGKRDIKKMLKQ